MAEPLIGPQPIIGPGDSPDVIGGNAPTTEYAPMNNAARAAIFGVNPSTGKAYTDAESAALNGGYNPWAGSVGYQVDPRSGNLNILKNDGTVMTTGAQYRTTGTGAIVPQASSLPPGTGVDENGKMYQPGQVMPGESLDAYIQRMATIGPGQLSYNGKFYQYNSRGMYYESGTQEPADFVDTEENSANTPEALRAQARASQMGTKDSTGINKGASSGSSTSNPFVPGSAAATAWDERKSAYDLLYTQFNQYGLGALITPLKGLITEGVPASEFTIRLRETEAYKKRFAANTQRIAKGLAAISEAEYLGLEDQYQNIMRNYGLPAEYYTRGDMGIQSGFEKFIANDVSAAELEDRVMTAQSRVMNANPEVLASLKAFYPDITNGDILAYTLDPTKGLTDIKRKVTAAEIGGAAMQAGLGITGTRAGELGAAGITKAQAQQGFQTVAEVAPRGGVLSEIYKQSPYTQTTAEAEVFGLAGSTDAARQRKKLTQLETAAFQGSAGAGAIARDRAGVL